MNTYFIEVMLCLFSSVQDAESLINQIHKSLQVVVERSAHGNVDVWELLKNVNFVEVNSELNLTKSTLLNFVVDNALTKEGMHQVLNEVKVGLSVKDTSISEQIQDMLQRVGTLWHNILEEILNLGNMSTILTESELITDLKTCNFYLLEIMQDYIVKSEPIGLQLHVSIVENSLKNLFAKLQLLKTTIVTENVIDKLVSQDKNQEGKRKSILEPILVGQKPYQGKPVENITETGAGAINVDGGRIGTDVNRGNRYNNKSPNKGKNSTVNLGKRIEKWDVSPGRWPSNLILHHLPGCKRIGVKRVRGESGWSKTGSKSGVNVTMSGPQYERQPKQDNHTDLDGYEIIAEWQCVEGCPVKIVGEQSGERRSMGIYISQGNYKVSPNWGGTLGTKQGSLYNDSGTAARYFQQPNWSYEIYEQLNNADLLQYITKPSTVEREAGLEKLPFGIRNRVNSGGYEADPKFAPVERKNTHPTVKSIALNKYLATLLLPPPEYAPRRILVPFCGSGSEIIGCLLAGWDEVIGIELEQEYYDIANERVAWWYGVMESCNYDVDNIIKHWQKEQKVSETGQLRLL